MITIVFGYTCEMFETQRTNPVTGFYEYSYAWNHDKLSILAVNLTIWILCKSLIIVSHTIWFIIDYIHETVLLRFDPILCKLENRALLLSPDCILFDLVWFKGLFLLNRLIIKGSFDSIWFDYISGPVYYSRPATESKDSVAESIEVIFLLFS